MRVLTSISLRRDGFALFSGALLALVGLFMAWAVSAQQANPDSPSEPDILALGGSVTETIVALGQQHRLKARDTTSNYPPDVRDLPDVGYIRSLSPEGVLSVGAELIIAEEGARPVEAVDVIRNSGATFVEIPEEYTPDGVIAKIRAVGDALGVPERAETLVAELRADFDAALARVAGREGDKPRVLFILSTRGGKINASGRGTSVDAMIKLAGGENVMDMFDGYKQVNDEAVMLSEPDLIVMFDREGDHGAADEALFAMGAIAPTPAAQSRSVFRMDGMLLTGFGPRTARAINQLSAALYGETPAQGGN